MLRVKVLVEEQDEVTVVEVEKLQLTDRHELARALERACKYSELDHIRQVIVVDFGPWAAICHRSCDRWFSTPWLEHVDYTWQLHDIALVVADSQHR